MLSFFSSVLHDKNLPPGVADDIGDIRDASCTSWMSPPTYEFIKNNASERIVMKDDDNTKKSQSSDSRES